MLIQKSERLLLLFGSVSKWGNKILNVINNIILIVVFLYGCFALLDTWAIFRGADINEGLLKYKPEILVGEEDSPTVQELQALYPDVRAWLTIVDTNIDYPIVQGADNLEYVNRDIEGNFALSGEIFLSSENTSNFSDDYNILYGHHMEIEKMFGGLDLFFEQSYMKEHSVGYLFLPSVTYELEIFATVSTDAYDNMVFTVIGDDDTQQSNLIDYIKQKAIVHTGVEISASEQIIAMSTCSSASTNERTIVFAKIKK